MSSKAKIIISTIVILVFGLTTIWSTAPSLFVTQLAYLTLGVLVMFIFSRLDHPVLAGFAWPSYFLCVGLLALTMIIGDTARGSTRWIYLGSLPLQTSEVAKPLLTIFFANFLANHNLNKTKNLLFYILLAAIPIGLIKIQPDLGSSLVIGFLAFVMAVFGGLSWKKVLAFLLFIAISLPFLPFILKDYQLNRLESFINPYHDPKGQGYNVIQSVIAIGSGGIIGKGVRLGSQSHLNFLPERHTDFIFASFAEEFGLLGITLVFISYYVLLSSIFRESDKLGDKQASLLMIGIFSIFAFQVLVNIGMNLGLMPVTGITLPLFSYGGNSLVSFMVLLGISIRLLELIPRYRL